MQHRTQWLNSPKKPLAAHSKQANAPQGPHVTMATRPGLQHVMHTQSHVHAPQMTLVHEGLYLELKGQRAVACRVRPRPKGFSVRQGVLQIEQVACV